MPPRLPPLVSHRITHCFHSSDANNLGTFSGSLLPANPLAGVVGAVVEQPLPRSLLSEVTKLHLSHPSGWKPKARSPMSPAAAGGGDDVLKVEENVRRRKLPASAWDIRRGLAQALVMKPEAKQCVQSMDTDADTRLPGFKSLLSHLLCDLGLLQPWLLALTAASGSLLCRVEG
ncbi:uncharacterized protein LOC121491656 isoform X4 [Vulpes lagopus]|uniref:uncharacterized protein LOC121491656 isoform X4 n=1 Tax=Vulpes lagopus TaxID=494514 RepID=UPI001BCA0646|nr:uncharacterized protein LOC121491656 isoform X4 [Vulpes lagopus]XP_041612819.1 uncharacterized protein LOC121491656 isoform X4 [Vulpes lagopus]XP_041612826.1 uncharacterized protein LOC121491656 isoform X4 [Vulpes lagopus]XP_041612834.1 uncharacterized protein LOC121491656 isoform X4 [Vulpes lagopus]